MANRPRRLTQADPLLFGGPKNTVGEGVQGYRGPSCGDCEPGVLTGEETELGFFRALSRSSLGFRVHLSVQSAQ